MHSQTQKIRRALRNATDSLCGLKMKIEMPLPSKPCSQLQPMTCLECTSTVLLLDALELKSLYYLYLNIRLYQGLEKLSLENWRYKKEQLVQTCKTYYLLTYWLILVIEQLHH